MCLIPFDAPSQTAAGLGYGISSYDVSSRTPILHLPGALRSPGVTRLGVPACGSATMAPLTPAGQVVAPGRSHRFMHRIFCPFRLQPPLVAPVAWLVSTTRRTVESDRRIQPTHQGRASPTSVGLRLGYAGSPRRQAESSSSSYGLVIHLPMLSTSPRGDAVPVDYGRQAGSRQGLPPCWFDTLVIARVPGLPPGASLGATREDQV